MKRLLFSIFLIIVLMISCASAKADEPSFSASGENQTMETNVNNNTSSVSSIEGNEWKLIAVYINGNDTQFNRNSLPAELGNSFTLTLDTKLASGVGAPNRYTAPYTLGDNQTITIMLMRSTLMATFLEPENLREHDFFTYMQNSYSWKLVNNNLELLSKTRDGGEVRLVFSL